MTWFKVDDQFDEHRKTRHLGRPPERLAAMGLWLACGVWASRNLSDGFVPEEVVTRYDPDLSNAERLCEAGLWVVAVLDGEDGYVFHEWMDHQPSRETVEKKRTDTRRRVQAFRGRQRADQQTRQRASSDGNDEGNALHDDERNAGGNAAPDPTRTRTHEETPEEESPSGGGSGEETSRKRSAERKSADPKGHRLPDDWWPTEEDRAWFRDKCPDLEGRGTALTEEFRDYWHSRAGKEARKIDWSKTWRNRMREKQDRAHNQKQPRDVRVPRVSASDSAAAVAQSLRRTPRESLSEPPQQPPLRLAAGGL